MISYLSFTLFIAQFFSLFSRVKVWNDPKFERGSLDEFLKLNDAEPGIWKILVEVDGEVSDKLHYVKLI